MPLYIYWIMLTQKNKHSGEQPDHSATEVTKNRQGNKAKTQRSDLFSTAPSSTERPAPVTRHESTNHFRHETQVLRHKKAVGVPVHRA